MTKQFSLNSLFEDAKYITVYDDESGAECGRITQEGDNKYLARMLIDKKGEPCNQTAECLSLQSARDFIKSGRENKGARRIYDEREPKEFRVFLCSEHQRKLLGTEYSETEANKLKKKEYDKRKPTSHRIEIIPIYE